MANRYESTFPGPQKNDFFFQAWENVDNKNGDIILTHGLGEHSDAYDEFGQRLSSAGWNVYAWDLPGHGRSPGQRGYIGRFSDFNLTLKYFIKHVESLKKISDSKTVLFGHSLGGLITLDFLSKNKVGDQFSEVCLSSPLLGVALKAPEHKLFFAKTLGKLIPRLTLHNEIDYGFLVRDQEFLKTYDQDPLRHNKISPLLYLGILDTCENVQRNAGKIQLPVFLQFSEHDKVVDGKETKQFFKRIKSKKKFLLPYKDSHHEIFNDLDKEQVYKDLIDHLNNQEKAN